MKETLMKKVIFVLFVFFTYIFAAAGNKEYEYILIQVKTPDVLKALFLDKIRPGTGKEEWKYAHDEIDKSLRESFNAVWQTFEGKKGLIKDTIIQDAIEKLRIKIKNKEKFISINFDLDAAYGIYYKDRFLVTDGNNILDSMFTYETMIKNNESMTRIQGNLVIKKNFRMCLNKIVKIKAFKRFNDFNANKNREIMEVSS
jgi:hypothetical protein